jgi:hypothetical protein
LSYLSFQLLNLPLQCLLLGSLLFNLFIAFFDEFYGVTEIEITLRNHFFQRSKISPEEISFLLNQSELFCMLIIFSDALIDKFLHPSFLGTCLFFGSSALSFQAKQLFIAYIALLLAQVIYFQLCLGKLFTQNRIFSP